MPLFKKKSRSRTNTGGAGASSGAPPSHDNSLAQQQLAASKKPKKKSFFQKLLGKKDKSGAPKERMKDRHITSKKALGGGSANDVQKVSYRRGIGNSGETEGYFKADFDRERVAKELEKALDDTFMPGLGDDIGIKDDDPRNAARAVASSRVDQLLGTNVLSQDTFAKHGGQVGVVSPQAKGRTIRENIYSDVADSRSVRSAKQVNMRAGGVFSIQGDQVFKMLVQKYNELDWADPEIQRGMANLQALDYLTGQIDRHGNNIVVDPETGQVTGIDNDLAFGSSYKDTFEEEGWDKNRGMPTLIDGELAERLVFMDDGQYEQTLRGKKGDYGHLNEDEIQAAMTRFYRLRAYCEELLADPENPDPRLVYEWNQQSLEATLALGANGSILGHHKACFEDAGYTAEGASVRGMRRPGEKMG